MCVDRHFRGRIPGGGGWGGRRCDGRSAVSRGCILVARGSEAAPDDSLVSAMAANTCLPLSSAPLRPALPLSSLSSRRDLWSVAVPGEHGPTGRGARGGTLCPEPSLQPALGRGRCWAETAVTSPPPPEPPPPATRPDPKGGCR